MQKSTPTINVILHEPEHPKDLRFIQDINNKTYAHAITKKLRSTNLTANEKQYIIQSLKTIHSESCI